MNKANNSACQGWHSVLSALRHRGTQGKETNKIGKHKFFTQFAIHSQTLGHLLERCARRITPGRMEQTNLTSSIVESRPNEKRTNEFAKSFFPMAKITCDGSKDPAEHAEPLDAQRPSTSKPANNAMLSAPRTTKETVLANEFARGLTISQPSIFSIAEINSSTKGFSRCRSKTGVLTNFSRAATRPMMLKRFSVPARRSFSWPPPNKIGSGCSGDLMYNKPAPLGP